MFIKVLFFLTLILSPPSFAIDKIYWEKLLHYKNNKGLADGPLFYLSPEGKTNPNAELAATLAAFKDPLKKAGWFNYPVQCVFRERYRFLKASGLLEDVLELPCTVFTEWKEGLNAESISLVFSSSYPNNPSSLFGHTLLKLNQKNKKDELLDYAIAFSAVPEKEDVGIVFGFKGFFGGYRGLYEITKYYSKVNEYTNGESRDLIEYDLKISPEELDRLINHLWELYQTTYFNYYFADENCSAVLADLLAVAYRFDDGVNRHARWYYLPSEMVKYFSTQKGKIKSVKYRASLKKQLARMWEKMSPAEVSTLKEILKKNEIPEEMKNIKVLDALVSYLEFTHYRLKKKLTEKKEELQRKALIKRSKLEKGINIEESFDETNRPEKSHDPQKINLFSRLENNTAMAGFEIKEGYHDLMSNDEGYDRFSQFDFLSASLLYDFERKKLRYDQLVLVNLISLHEYTFFDPQISWKAKVSAERIYDLQCTLCHKMMASAYGGTSFRLGKEKQFVFNITGGLAGEVSRHFNRGYRLGPGIEISLYGQIMKNYKIGFFNETRFDIKRKIKKDFYNTLGIRHSFFTDNKKDYRFESTFISRQGSLSKNMIMHQVTYGRYF